METQIYKKLSKTNQSETNPTSKKNTEFRERKSKLCRADKFRANEAPKQWNADWQKSKNEKKES